MKEVSIGGCVQGQKATSYSFLLPLPLCVTHLSLYEAQDVHVCLKHIFQKDFNNSSE